MRNSGCPGRAFVQVWRRRGAVAAVVVAALALVTTAPLAPSHAQEGDFTGPPPATAYAGSVTVPLGLGTYCWTDPGAEVGLCADTIGIVTDPTALTVPVGSLVTVAYPSGITEAFVRASPLPGEPIQDDGATLVWAPEGEGQELAVHLRPGAFGFFADLAAGQYLMSIRLFVPEGDVSYGLILDVSADGQGSPANANEFLTLLAEAGFGGVEILEIALMRDWIPDAFSPRYIVGGATLEIFALATPAAVAAALGNLDVNGGDVTPAEDIAIWGAGSLLVILLNASDQGEFQAVIATLVGPPHLVTPEDLGPQPDPAALAQTVDTVRAALVAAGFEVMLEPVAVNRPFLPSNALSQVLSADGATVEVYALAEPDFQRVLDELSSVEPLPLREGIVWVSGSTLVILPASDQAGLVPAVIGALGTPVFVGPEASTGPIIVTPNGGVCVVGLTALVVEVPGGFASAAAVADAIENECGLTVERIWLLQGGEWLLFVPGIPIDFGLTAFGPISAVLVVLGGGDREMLIASAWTKAFCPPATAATRDIDALLLTALAPNKVVDLAGFGSAVRKAAASLPDAGAALAALAPPDGARAFHQAWGDFLGDAADLVRDSLDASGALRRSHSDFSTEFTPLISAAVRNLVALEVDLPAGISAALQNEPSCDSFRVAFEALRTTTRV